MPADPLRFLRLVFDAWDEEGLTSPWAVAKAGGPSKETVRHWGEALATETPIPEPRTPTWEKTDASTGWQKGSARRVWNGGEPRSRLIDLDDMSPEDAAEVTALIRRLASKHAARPSQSEKEA